MDGLEEATWVEMADGYSGLRNGRGRVRTSLRQAERRYTVAHIEHRREMAAVARRPAHGVQNVWGLGLQLV